MQIHNSGLDSRDMHLVPGFIPLACPRQQHNYRLGSHAAGVCIVSIYSFSPFLRSHRLTSGEASMVRCPVETKAPPESMGLVAYRPKKPIE